jgi:type IV secretory pathway protease TraF
MEKGIKSKNQVRRARWFALGCLAGVAGMCAVCAIGLRVNGTGSEPVGIYWAVSKAPSKGDFVFPPGAYRAKADSESTEWDELQQGWYDCPKR